MAERTAAAASHEILRTYLNHDLETFTHRHEILAAAVVPHVDQGDRQPLTLYHWRPPLVRAATKVLLHPDRLQYVKEFASLGTFLLPTHLDIDSALSDLLAAMSQVEPDAALPTKPTPQFLADVIAQLPTPDEGDNLIQFFSFPVFGNSADDVLGEGFLPVWKWAKPESAYRTGGLWNADLHEALEDGEWNGGRGLMVLVGGVSEETKQEVARGQVMRTSFGSLTNPNRLLR